MNTINPYNKLIKFNSGRLFLPVVAALLCLTAGVRAQFVSTVVSNMAEPNSVAVIGDNAYITDKLNDRIVVFSPTAGTYSTFAGISGVSGSNSGSATAARFNGPTGIVAARGGLVVVDQGNQLIRFVTTSGTVSTIAGTAGTTGTNDGAGLSAEFNNPSGIAVDTASNLYVADLLNNRIRMIAVNNTVSTIAVTGYAFYHPTGIAIDSNTNIWVSDTGHQVIVEIPLGSSSVTVVAGVSGESGYSDTTSATTSLFSVPTALLWVGGSSSNLLVVDTGNNVIRNLFLTNEYGPTAFVVTTYSGTGAQGIVNGSPSVAEYSNPVGISVDPYDAQNSSTPAYYIVDQNTGGSGDLRAVELSAPIPAPAPPTFGYVSFVPQSSTSFTLVSQFTAASTNTFNNVATIAVEAASGTSTFITYGATGSAISLPTANSGTEPETYQGDGKTVAQSAPSIIPNPLPSITINAISVNGTGQVSTNVSAVYQFVCADPTISGTNAAAVTLTDTTTNAEIFFTIDGSTPTNIPATNCFGPISSGTTTNITITTNVTMKAAAFLANFSPSGVTTLQLTISNYVPNSAGFSSTTKMASGGGNLLVPIMVNLAQSGAVLKSLQFRAEVAPVTNSNPSTSALSDLQFGPNDYFTLPGVTVTNTYVTLNDTNYNVFATYSTYANGITNGMYVYSTPGDFTVTGSGAVALVEFHIPSGANYGDTYNLTVINPSGTSDGIDSSVPLVGGSNIVTIANPVFLIGDTAPATGYNASEFGDGELNNADVNNIMYASVGIREPNKNSDAYTAMLVDPIDTIPGYNDWNMCLQQSLGLGLAANPVQIAFYTNGSLMYQSVTLTNGVAYPLGLPHERTTRKLGLGNTPPGQVWLCQASVRAGTVANATPGAVCSIPVSVNVNPGYSLSGMQFRAVLVADGSAPIPGTISFTPASGLPNPIQLTGLGPNDIACFWANGAFANSLTGSRSVGTVSFQIPAGAQPGQQYELHFFGVGGGPGTSSIYQLESFPASVWVSSPALTQQSVTSDEWKTTFFGSITSPLAADNVDADGDGLLNWQEYVAGTNPTNAASVVQFTPPTLVTTGVKGVGINWLTAPGKTYTLEASSSLQGPVWTPINTNLGDGNYYQFVQTNHSAAEQFYQLRVHQ